MNKSEVFVQALSFATLTVVAPALFTQLGCASRPTHVISNRDTSRTAEDGVAGATSSDAEGADSQDKSTVLSDKKCPKNAKLVNNKCMLQVESTE